jgi:hypothetical protein
MPARLGSFRGVQATVFAAGLVIAATVLAEPSPTPRFSWLFNGDVFGLAQAGNVLYVGGDFTRVSPGDSAAGHLVALSPLTGSSVSPALPIADEIVTAIAPDGDGGYYLAGRFTTFGSGAIVRGKNTRLAHVLADGSVDTAFAPDITGAITSLAFAGPSVVVIGDVTSSPFNGLLVVDAATGQLRPWTPVLPSTNPRVLHAVASAGVVYVLWDDALSSHVTAFDGGSGLVAWTAAVPGRVPDLSSNSQETVRVHGALAGTRLIVGLDRVLAIDAVTGDVQGSWGGSAPGNAVVSALRIHGSIVYVAGAFDSWAGQTRRNLAALDLVTGALLPWAPQASAAVTSLVVSPDGTVFVGAEWPLTVNGQQPTGFSAIDAAGNVTGWAAQPAFSRVTALALSSSGTLIAGTSLVTTDSVARMKLAAFDATTGALLPPGPLAIGDAEYVGDLAATGHTLFVAIGDASGGVNIRAVDIAGAGTPSTIDYGPGLTFGPVDATWLYVNTFNGGASRYELATLARDTGFHSEHRVVAASPALIGVRGTNVAVLDPASGSPAKRVLVHPVPEWAAADGDTVYQLGLVPGTAIMMRGSAFEVTTGKAVTGPAVSGRLLALAAADGRLFFGGADITTPSGVRTGLIETDRHGVPTAWDPGFGHAGPLAPGVVRRVVGLGNRLVAAGSADFWNNRVAVFDLRGPTAPSGLRSRDLGTSIELSWDGVPPPSPRNYVLEAGYAPGTTAVQLPVGSATTFTAPGPVAGPVFVRVRNAHSAETSNEIVVGCFPPAPPTNLAATLWPGGVALSWQPPAGAESYSIIGGTTPNGREIGTLLIPGNQRSFVTGAPAGTYFVRVRASNACGTSGDSGEVFFTVGAALSLPAAPRQPIVTVSGSTVSLAWEAQGSSEAQEFALEVGRTPGLADLLTLRIPRVTVNTNGATYATFLAVNVPSGTYYLRIRAINAAGAGPPSPEAIAAVP